MGPLPNINHIFFSCRTSRNTT